MKSLFLCLTLSCFFSSLAFSNPRKGIECQDSFNTRSLEVFEDGRSYHFKLRSTQGVNSHHQQVMQSLKKGSFSFEIPCNFCEFNGQVVKCVNTNATRIQVEEESNFGTFPLGKKEVIARYLSFEFNPVTVKQINPWTKDLVDSNLHVAAFYAVIPTGLRSEKEVGAQVDFATRECSFY